MPQYDVYRNPVRPGYLVDCQSDLLHTAETRLAVPLVGRDMAPARITHLNPMFDVEGEPHVMLTQFASAVRLKPLGDPVGSLSDDHYEIMRALDVLLIGV